MARGRNDADAGDRSPSCRIDLACLLTASQTYAADQTIVITSPPHVAAPEPPLALTLDNAAAVIETALATATTTHT